MTRRKTTRFRHPLAHVGERVTSIVDVRTAPVGGRKTICLTVVMPYGKSVATEFAVARRVYTIARS